MSEEYKMPEEGFVRRHIAQTRLKQMIPDYDLMTNWERNRAKQRRGIITCPACHYPQKVENKICCFCEVEFKLK